MQLEKGYLYHIFNQGNNQRKIFFKRDNYIFFLKKIKTQYINCQNLRQGFAWSKTLTNLTPKFQYSQFYFVSIHQNPVKANLIQKENDYEFLSAKDFAGLREHQFVKKSSYGTY